MKVDVVVPSAGESVTEATVSALLVEPGSSVSEDDPIVELETDKANMPILAPMAGSVEILVAEGDDVTVGQVIARIDTEGAGAVPAEAPKAEEEPAAAPAPPQSKPAIEAAPAPAVQTQTSTSAPSASPAAQALMDEHQLPTGSVAGSGHGGRVLKEDVLAQIKNPTAMASAMLPPMPDMGFAASLPQPIVGERETHKKMTRLRRTIAKRLVQVKQDTAMLTTFNEVDLSHIMKMRSAYKDKFVDKFGVKLGFMSFFVKASVEAMRTVPEVNAYIDGDDVVTRHYFDISIAVGTDRGLVVPVLRDCEQLSFADIEKEIANYAKRAREGSLSLEDLEGGGFTITNGGIYGSLISTPIINPPQSAILGMHKIQERPVAIDGEIVIRPMMYLALSYDHRIIDGKEAVSFLVKIKESLEDPAHIMLEI